MSCCANVQCDGPDLKPPDRRYRRVLWAALAINTTLFMVEIVAGLTAASAALQADALDFLADAANYGISLFVVGMALRYRATAALAKGLTMSLLGLWVLAITLWHAWRQTLPEAPVMGVIGIVALIANGICFVLLWSSRHGDSNKRAVWVCSRNDVIGNLAVLLATIGVFGTGTGWPDVMVAAIMACLALQGAWQVIRLAVAELEADSNSRDQPKTVAARIRRLFATLTPSFTIHSSRCFAKILSRS
jgi:Co/Zn/Cd efflux system component